MLAPENEQIPYSHEFMVDPGYQRSLARALFAASFRRPWWWLLLAIFLLLIEGTLFSTLPWEIPVFWIILAVALCGFSFLQTRRVIFRVFPVGKVLKSGFGTDSFAISDGSDASVLSFAGFDQIDVRDEVVWLRRANPKRRLAFPRALFPDSELDRIRNALAKTQGSQLS